MGVAAHADATVYRLPAFVGVLGCVHVLSVPGIVAQTVEVAGNATVVGQAVRDDRVRDEVVTSFDLFVDVEWGRVLLQTYLEANTTPFRGGVSTLVGEANADAGTALGSRREGRVQISEVRLVLPVAEDLRAHAGLLDATGFLDVSRIANDENLFFLGVPFVNNPTIAFPDYALGGALEGALPGTTALRVGAVVTSSHGLADNPGVSYSQLLDLNDEDKGLFAGSALRRVTDRSRFSLGAWVHTAPHPRLDGAPGSESNRGVFAVVGWTFGAHSVSFRGGVANGDVSVADGFAGVTYLLAQRPNALGVAVGRSFASEGAAGLSDVIHGEGFVRRRLVGEVFLTASVQRIVNSGFDASDTVVPAELWIAGIRLSAQF